MTTQTSRTNLSPKRGDNVIIKTIRSLAQPSNELQGDDLQKAASLVALTLLFIPLAIFTIIAIPVQDMITGQEITPPNIGGGIALLSTFMAYGLSRTRMYRIGAYMIVAIPIIAVVVASLSSVELLTDVGLIYISLSFILSSLLLSSRATLISGLLAVLATVFLYMVRGYVTQEFPILIIMFMLVATGVLSLTSRIREQNMAELMNAQAELRERIQEANDAREKAERSDQVKSTFLASMSHELRTPLNAIINFTRFVVKGLLGPVTDEQVETLNNVIISGKHLLNLINDVLDMSKIESDSLNLFVSDDVEIAHILGDVATMGQALLDDKAVELTVNIEENLPLIRGDQQRIHQIFLNIVSNACKFTKSGTIEFSAKQENSEILVSIVDTGPGIAKEDMDSVFEAFKQTTTGLRQGGGTGLGMPITKSLVEAHYGKIRMESTVGEGTEFYIHLPVRSENLTPTLITES